ncbi:transporter [Bacteroidales bacterium]|nr:transporter [Bacteroidales bacterium]
MRKDGFSSQIGALMAIIGSAVGLGNLWKFPYIAGKNGGATFIFLYIGFMIILCLPLMLSELVIGRRAGLDAAGSFKKLAPNTKWYITGLIGVVTAFTILSFYSVVGGWTIEYLISSLTFKTEDSNAQAHFTDFIQSPIRPLFLHLSFIVLTAAVLWTGVKNGIEKFSKYLMPLLFLMILGLAIFSLSLPNAMLGVEFLLKPNFADLSPGLILDALGQGLFSLSLGMGTIITYSAYIDKKENLVQIAVITIVMDLIFALLASLVILPAVFSFGFQPNEGPGLLFITLPQIFLQMPFGSYFAIVFFSVLFIAALSSSISLLEVIVAYMCRATKLSRKKNILIIVSALSFTGAICSLSLGPLANFKIFGNSIFDFFDILSSTYLMPLGALLISLFLGWKMKKTDVYDELSNSGSLVLPLFNMFIFLVRYFVPLAIILIFLNKLQVF